MPSLYISLRTSFTETLLAWNVSETNSESPIGSDWSFGSSGPSEEEELQDPPPAAPPPPPPAAVVKLGSCLIKDTR